MIWFWIAAALISAAAAALIVQRAARATDSRGGENPSLAVYRRQMAEIDELAGQGLLAEPDRRAVRAEAGRRLLAAAERVETPLKTSRPLAILLVAAAAPLIALVVYVAIGVPGFPDQPFARRLAEWRAAPDPVDSLTPPQLAALMRAAAAEKPNDPGPLYFLAKYEVQSGEFTEASQALDKAIALAPKRGDFWDLKGEIEMAAAGGELTSAARKDYQTALALDPRSPFARFRFGAEKIKDGDVKGGLSDWRSLELDLDPSDPRRQSLAEAISQVEAGGKAPAPVQQAAAPPSGPQIQGMVDGLAARLKASPDNPDGWVRLVRAYGVLGEADRQAAALAEARKLYAGRADVLGALDQAARPAS